MYPALIPDDHVLANVSDVYNGILVRGDVVGDTLHYGQGLAGRDCQRVKRYWRCRAGFKARLH